MADYGPRFYTQTLKWFDDAGNARGRWHRLDGINNQPFTVWDAGDGDGPQRWEFQEFNCSGFDSGMQTGSVSIACAYSPAVMGLLLQAAARRWFIELTQYEIVPGGLSRIDSVLLGSIAGSGSLTGITITGTSSPPPVAVTIPSIILTQSIIGTPCRLDFV